MLEDPLEYQDEWDMGRRGKNGKEDAISPDEEGPRIQAQTELNLALTHLCNFLAREPDLSTSAAW